MLLAIKTLNVIGVFWSVNCHSVKQFFIVSQIPGSRSIWSGSNHVSYMAGPVSKQDEANLMFWLASSSQEGPILHILPAQDFILRSAKEDFVN